MSNERNLEDLEFTDYRRYPRTSAGPALVGALVFWIAAAWAFALAAHML